MQIYIAVILEAQEITSVIPGDQGKIDHKISCHNNQAWFMQEIPKMQNFQSWRVKGYFYESVPKMFPKKGECDETNL